MKIECGGFSCRILCVYSILYIFSITVRCCQIFNQLNLLSPTLCTYYVVYGYHLQIVRFLLSANSAQTAFESSEFQ